MNLKSDINENELKQLRSQLGISEQDAEKFNCTPTSPIERGDVFSLTGVNKVRETAENNFMPLVFTTSTGKLIGTKHFGKIDFPKGTTGVQPIGRTVDDALKYLLWAKQNKLTFEVEDVRKLPERKIKDVSGSETVYRPKQFDLSVRLPKAEEPEEKSK